MSTASQATDWFLLLRENASEESLRGWIEWCAQDPRNLAEFERIRRTWQGAGQLQPALSDLLQELGSQASAPAAKIPPRRMRHIWPIAAAIACIALGTVSWNIHTDNALRPVRPPVATMLPPANQTTTLPDGSLLTLAPSTTVAVEFDRATRRLKLSQGEAFFKVSPDKQKPFVVQTGELQVTAIGTAFNVKSDSRKIVVTVEEGTIEARRESGQAWRVGAGYQIAYDLAERNTHIAAVDPGRELAWREGRLEYFMAPLEAVAADASRYSNRKIEIHDPIIARLPFTGTIFTQSIDDWLQAVQSTFPVRVETHEGRVVLLSR